MTAGTSAHTESVEIVRAICILNFKTYTYQLKRAHTYTLTMCIGHCIHNVFITFAKEGGVFF